MCHPERERCVASNAARSRTFGEGVRITHDPSQKREGQAQLVRRPKRDLKTARMDFSVLNVTFIRESLLKLKGDPFLAKSLDFARRFWLRSFLSFAKTSTRADKSTQVALSALAQDDTRSDISINRSF